MEGWLRAELLRRQFKLGTSDQMSRLCHQAIPTLTSCINNKRGVHFNFPKIDNPKHAGVEKRLLMRHK